MEEIGKTVNVVNDRDKSAKELGSFTLVNPSSQIDSAKDKMESIAKQSSQN